MTRKRTTGKLTRKILMDKAGTVYFERGEEYFEQGHVKALLEKDGIIRAYVTGTKVYRAALSLSSGEMNWKCSCPLGKDQEFCKHLVATGLAYIDGQKKSAKSSIKSKPITPKVIESYLSKQAVSDLVHIVMEQADIDEEFYAMLKLRVVAESASGNTSEMRNVLRQAMTITDFVSWRDTGSYMRGVDRVVGQLSILLTSKHAAQVIELAEYGMDLWEENIEVIDDSNGCMGMLRDDLHQLHFDACTAASPEPVALAERIATRAINSKWEMFYGSYKAYRDIFGVAGRARYREIVEAEWNALPSIAPDKEDPEEYGRSGTLKKMILDFAEEDRDLDLVISILSRDLSHSYCYLRIAERYRKSRKYKLAREWAEKGLAAFDDHNDSRLRNFLADEYLRTKRTDDAMAMIWGNFEERPSLETYQDLAKYSKKVKSWEKWREKAFVHLRADVKNRKAVFEEQKAGNSSQKQSVYYRWSPQPPDHSLLVTILLWEKYDEKAWAEAQSGGCREQLWLDMAKRREKTHPKNAIDIYRRQVKTLAEQTNNMSYQEAVVFLGRIHTLMKKGGNEKEFSIWLNEIKTEYKRKRNFIKYVERRAWGVGIL